MPKPNINVTPLIDVLLVLLIVFMIVSPLKPTRFEAKIPEPPDSEAAGQESHGTLVVSLKPDGSMLLNGNSSYASSADLPKLTSDIRQYFESLQGVQASDRRVFVKAPKSVTYGKVVGVIDAVKMSGSIPLGLQIDGLKTSGKESQD